MPIQYENFFKLYFLELNFVPDLLIFIYMSTSLTKKAKDLILMFL